MTQFYTYLYLRDDGSPYYVGKGQGNRAYDSERNHRPPKDRNRIKVQYWPDEATAFAYEVYQIDFWGRKDIGTGILINHTAGGEGHAEISEETKRKISESKIGIKHSEVTRKKMSLASKGVPKSEEHIKNIVKAKTGVKHSEETKQRLRELKTGTKQSPETIAKKVNSRAGYRHSEETIRKLSKSNIGKHQMSEETIKKMSASHKGKIPWNKGIKLAQRNSSAA